MSGISVNGSRSKQIDVTESLSVAELLLRHEVPPETRFLAVAVNGAVVRRAEWSARMLVPGDVVEIVRPLQGG